MGQERVVFLPQLRNKHRNLYALIPVSLFHFSLLLTPSITRSPVHVHWDCIFHLFLISVNAYPLNQGQVRGDTIPFRVCAMSSVLSLFPCIAKIMYLLFIPILLVYCRIATRMNEETTSSHSNVVARFQSILMIIAI